MARLASGEIDLTVDESDQEIRIVESVTRPSTKKAATSRNNTPLDSTKQPSKARWDGVPPQKHKRKGLLVDLRSDAGISDSESHRSSTFDTSGVLASGLESGKRVKMRSRKLAPSLRSKIAAEGVIDVSEDARSSGEEFPPLPPVKPSPTDQNSRKRPLDPAGSGPLKASASKKAKLDRPSVPDKISPNNPPDTSRNAPGEEGSQEKHAGVESRAASAGDSQKRCSKTPSASRPAVPSTHRDLHDRPPSSPFGLHPDQHNTSLRASNPLPDSLASGNQRVERKQSVSQDSGKPMPKAANTVSSQPKTNGNRSSLRNSPLTSPQKSAGSSRASAAKAHNHGERRSRDVLETETSLKHTSGRKEQSRKQRKKTSESPKTSKASIAFTEQPGVRESAGSKEQQVGSSDEDQGYASLGSGSVDGQTLDSVPHADSQSASIPNRYHGPASGAHVAAGDNAYDTMQDELKPAKKKADVAEQTLDKDANMEEVRGSIEGLHDVPPTNSVIGAERNEQTQQDSTPLQAGEKDSDEAARRDSQIGTKIPMTDFGKGRSRKLEAATEAAQADDQLQSEALRAQSASLFAIPHSAASALKSAAAFSKLPLASKVERSLGQYLEELAQDNEYWTSNSLMRARVSKGSESQPHARVQEQSTSFRHMKPLPLRPSQTSDPRKLMWGIEKMANGKPVSSEKVMVPRQTFTTETQDVPSYAHYVSITNNILAQNSKTLHCWPYFGDNFDHANADNLKEQYHLDIDSREQKLLRLRQAQKYEEYVESTLMDLDCSWSDVLRFLLEETPAVGINPDAMKALNNRHEFCKEDFDRHSKRWVTVQQSLPPSTTEQLARAAVLCENFQKMAHFPLWHVAKRSSFCTLPEKDVPADDSTSASDELTCRICMRFNCPYHGEISERPVGEDEDNDSETSSVSIVATDLVHPPKVNYRARVAFPAIEPLCEDIDSLSIKPGKKDHRYWQSFQTKAEARGPFYPCSHPGKSCDDEDADCMCYAENLPCEKFCGCARSCARRFEGCSCSTQRIRPGKRGPCFEDERCACWQLGRECDPDLCGECGVCEVVDPVNKHDEAVKRGRCQNASIQRGMPKCTLLGDSGIHGLGLYACEDILHHEFVGEYKGEIITKEEAERRGAVYEHQKLSYLFSLNRDQEIDSTYFGNKIRFINHASDNKENLYPRIIMVNTVHRIALYASRYIRKGEELLFNYGPMFPDEQLGGKRSKKSAPHVRNANLVREFYDVEEDEDELGNLRAKGVSGGPKGKKPKPRGGARPGAGRKPRSKAVEKGQEVGDEKQHEGALFENGEFAGQDAGERLAAYNVADDRASDQMDADIDAGLGAEDQEDDDYEESELEEMESEVSDESEMSEDGTEPNGIMHRRPGRPIKRKSWRMGR